LKSIIITWAILLAFSLSASAETFPVGWFDWMPDSPPSDVALSGGNSIVMYNDEGLSYDDAFRAYLDAAHELGLSVIVDVRVLSHNGIARAGDLSRVARQFGDHPALAGWYAADEPYQGRIPLERYQAAYDALTDSCPRPVFMAFNDGDILFKYTVTARTAYDTGLLLDYRIAEDHPELPVDQMEQWKERMDLGVSQQKKLGKNYYAVLPAFGKSPKRLKSNFRLLTRAEIRFMAFYAVTQMEVDGIYFWGLCRAKETSPNPSLPYPKDGMAWLEEVGVPLLEELKTYGGAVTEGALPDAVSADRKHVICRVYLDPSSGNYYLLVVNSSRDATAPTISLSLPESVHLAQPLFESQTPPRKVQANCFIDELPRYGVRAYQLLCNGENGL